MNNTEIEAKLEAGGTHWRAAVRTVDAPISVSDQSERGSHRSRAVRALAVTAAVVAVMVIASLTYAGTARKQPRQAGAATSCSTDFGDGTVRTQSVPGGIRAAVTIPYQGSAPCSLPGYGPWIDLLAPAGTTIASTETTLYRVYGKLTVKPGESIHAGVTWGRPCGLVLQPDFVIFVADGAFGGVAAGGGCGHRSSIWCLCGTPELPRWPRLIA